MKSSSLPGMVSTPEKTPTTPRSVSKRVQGSSNQVEIPDVGTFTSGSTSSADDGSQNDSDDDDGHGDASRNDAASYDDQDLSTLDFTGSFQELDFHRFHRMMWMVFLAIGGFLDMAASASTILRTYGGCAGRVVSSSSGIRENHSQVVSMLDGSIHRISFCHDVWTPFVIWLEEHHVTISFVFSLLWFRLAFFKASNLCKAAMDKKDRSCLLADENAKANDGKTMNNNNNANPQVVYIRRILIELALLPVGFYIILYHFGKGLIYEGKPLSEAFAETPDGVQEAVVLTITNQENGVEYESFTEKSRTSLLGATIFYFCRTIMGATIIVRAELMEYITRSAMPTLIRKLLRNAMRNPLKFNRQLRNTLTYLRWIKYIAPLIGTFNKLKGNVEDMAGKIRQEIIAKKQQRVRKILWGKKSQPVREEDAAIIIQSAYRAHVSRRLVHALMLLSDDNEALSAQRIQEILKRQLAYARMRLFKKGNELYLLEKQRRKDPNKLREQDRRRLYELQDEFTEEAAKTVNRRLLMRPNTKFAVIWKVMFVICIGIEIAQQFAPPWLIQQKTLDKSNSSDEIGIREFIALSLIPKPTRDFHQCKKSRRSVLQNFVPGALRKEGEDDNHSSSWICNKPFSTWWDGIRDLMALALMPSPVSEWPECAIRKTESLMDRLVSRFFKPPKPIPWYCSEPYASFQAHYVGLVNFFIDEFMIIVSIVCFLDVWVTFFTGEIDPVTGELVPKPFFARWILPGLVLQLLVNPSIGPVSRLVFDAMRSIIKIGPVRVYRWFIAVGLPLLYCIMKFVAHMVYRTMEGTEWLLVSYRMKQAEMNIFIL